MNISHTVSEYVGALAAEGLIKSADISEDTLSCRVEGLTFDSREAAPGTLFICKGANFRAEYLDSAFEKGAFCYVSGEVKDPEKPGIIVCDIRRAMAVCANLFGNEAWRAFPLVGLTGTKGKSTTAYYIKNIAEKYSAGESKPPIAYLSTIDTFDGKEFFESHLTTPEAVELGRRFMNARDAGVSAMVMEVSSQALKYDRTYGVCFDIACFMNFGADHIGGLEHPDLGDYLTSKLRIFTQCRTAVINLDTECLDRVLEAAKKAPGIEKIIYFSSSGKEEAGGVRADYTVRNVIKDNDEIRFDFMVRKGAAFEKLECLALTMPGLFNVENAAAAAVICLELGIPLKYIRDGLFDARAAGRMEHFRSDARDLDVIVDYAHNELSFHRLFSSVREEFPGRRVEALFGCPGGKGLSRREELPRAVAAYADFVWVTEEDPGFEDVLEISAQVAANLEKYGCPCRIIADRQQCIRTAIEEAAPGTVLVLAAKGREGYMKRGAVYVPVDSDVEITEKYL